MQALFTFLIRRPYVITALMLLTMSEVASANEISKKPAPLSPTLSSLDQASQHFFERRGQISGAADCLPILVDQAQEVGTFYLYCSPDSQASDSRGVELTPSIAVPDKLARRFHFWRRVYSLWSIDQFVLHISAYPEVVLEVADTSRVDAQVGDKKRSKMAKDLLTRHQRDYRNLLLAMHKSRKLDRINWTPAMLRIEESMQHIQDPNKYQIAAQAMRVQRGQRDFIAKGISMASRYFPAIEAEFAKQGVPVELSRLAFVESSFNLAAESKVGASGVYQLMEETARQWLRVSELIDERNDPVKASRVAAKVLRQYYKITGSWQLAITSYNHGVNGIRQAVRATGSQDLPTLIEKYRGNAFGFASQNFYTEYCAILATLQHSKELFPEVETMPALAFQTMRLHKPTSISEVRQKNRMTNEDFAFLNRDVSRQFIRMNGSLPAGFVVKVPMRTAQNPAADSITLTTLRVRQ